MESNGAEGKERIFRPPTVPDELWSLVPAENRQEILDLAARKLRSGIHPKVTVTNYLRECGILQTPVHPKIQAPTMLLKRRPVPAVAVTSAPPPAAVAPSSDAPPKRGGLKVKVPAQAAADDDDDFDVDDEDDVFETFIRPAVDTGHSLKPLRPFGLKVAPATNSTPKGHIGHALHRLFGFPGEPGNKAADAEASVLRAIAADPSYAIMEPDQLGNYGCAVPQHILSSIKDLIVQEAQRVEADILARQDNGDPTTDGWSNPDDWVDIE